MMFSPLATADIVRMGRGLVLLVAIIIIGVATAETQLNTLTQRHEFIQVANIRRDADGTYGVYVLGQGITAKALYPVGTIKNTASALIVGVGDRYVTIPTALYFDISAINPLWAMWSRQFVDEAYATKQELQHYLASLQPYLRQCYQKVYKLILNMDSYLKSR